MTREKAVEKYNGLLSKARDPSVVDGPEAAAIQAKLAQWRQDFPGIEDEAAEIRLREQFLTASTDGTAVSPADFADFFEEQTRQHRKPEAELNAGERLFWSMLDWAQDELGMKPKRGGKMGTTKGSKGASSKGKGAEAKGKGAKGGKATRSRGKRKSAPDISLEGLDEEGSIEGAYGEDNEGGVVEVTFTLSEELWDALADKPERLWEWIDSCLGDDDEEEEEEGEEEEEEGEEEEDD